MNQTLSPHLPEEPTQSAPQPDQPPSSPSPQPSGSLPPPGEHLSTSEPQPDASLARFLPLPAKYKPEPLFFPPPTSPKRRGNPWLVGILVALLVALPIVGYFAYQTGRTSISQTSVQAGVTVVIETPTPDQDTPTPTATLTPTPTVTAPSAPGWQNLQVFTGTATQQITAQQTTVFTTPAEWRIVWQETMSGPGVFELDLYTSTGQYVNQIGGQANESVNATYDVQSSPGSFYFRITSDGASYTVKVQV